MTAARVARACLATLASASLTTKYAIASMVGLQRGSTSTLTVTGTGERAGQPGQCGIQAAVGQHRRMDSAGQIAQLGQRLLGILMRLVQQPASRFRVVVVAGARPAQVHRDGHQPLLGAVVQIPFDPPALGVHRIHHLRLRLSRNCST